MIKETYLISEAEKLTGEKAHVLRYWEDELGLVIGRNSMGHRHYTAQDIRIFLTIKELKKKGLHLKAIRERLQQPEELVPFPETELPGSAEAVSRAEEEPGAAIQEKAGCAVPETRGAEPGGKESEDEEPADADCPDGVPKIPEREPLPPNERMQQFYQILDRLVRQLAMKRRQEERCKRVDEAIRKRQQTRRETAATLEHKQNGRKNRHRAKE